MGGKNKAKGNQRVPQKLSHNPPIETKKDGNPEQIDRFQKLDELVNKLKALSPTGAKTVTDLSSKQSDQDVKTTNPNGNLREPEKSREEIELQRKRKKEELLVKKAAAKAKQGDGSANKQQVIQKPENAGKSDKMLCISVDGIVKVDPESSPDRDKSNLKVRFDLQPTEIDNSAKIDNFDTRYVMGNETNVYPPFKVLAAKCDVNKIRNSNDLLKEFHYVLIEYLKLFQIPAESTCKGALLLDIEPQLSYLKKNVRHKFPLVIGNLIRQFKKKLNEYSDENDENILKDLIHWLESSFHINFKLAEMAISTSTIDKLKTQNGKVVMTYGRCPVIEKIILDAEEKKLGVHIFVIDNPSIGNGKFLLETLSEAGIPCTYGHLGSVAYLMEQCNIVLLGSSAILSNGRVVADRGSSLIALCAQSYNVPVLVVAKTCTFVDKVRLDEHLSTALLKDPLETISEDLVTALVTDLRILPPSSAPAVLKAKKLGSN